MSRIRTYLQKCWKAEATKFNWLPVLFGLGIGLYFALPVEPARWILPLLSGLAAIVYVRSYLRLPVRIALLLIAIGAAAAQVATYRVNPVLLHEALTPRPISGVVDGVERTEHGLRLYLRNPVVSDFPAEQTPERIRLSVRLKKDTVPELPNMGDTVQLMAGLMPPMGPALPHSFDFARHFYFQNIGAVGFGLPPWKVTQPVVNEGLRDHFRNWRTGLTNRIITQLGPEVGPVAAGLVTGDARAIREVDFEALRASNLYHIIAISGEHMAVIAGFIFVGLRLLALVLLPSRFRFRPEVKSVAAALALLLVTAYLFVTGLPTSAVRAYWMIALVLGAVMLARRVDAVRSLAITAFIMLLWHPADVLDPGFQLSFAATLAILTLVERVLASSVMQAGFAKRAFAAIATMLMVSVVAELATAPIAIAHFNNISLYGIPANMVATSLVSFFLMPTVALFFLLLPFGLQHVALSLMGYGIEGLMAIAHFVSSLPHAQQFVPSIPAYGMALFGLGLLWLCLWHTHWRRYGLVAMLLGVATLALNPTPDMLIGPGGKQVALRAEGEYALARGKPDAMLAELWAHGLGYAELAPIGDPQWRCDGWGCIARVEGKRIALPKAPAALLEDCTMADVIAASSALCGEGQAKIIGGKSFENQVTALWLKGRSIRTESSADWQGDRPWSHTLQREDEED